MCRIPDIGYSSISNRNILICLQFFCMYINQCTIFDNCFSFFLALRNLYNFVINLIYGLIQMDFLLLKIKGVWQPFLHTPYHTLTLRFSLYQKHSMNEHFSFNCLGLKFESLSLYQLMNNR